MTRKPWAIIHQHGRRVWRQGIAGQCRSMFTVKGDPCFLHHIERLPMAEYIPLVIVEVAHNLEQEYPPELQARRRANVLSLAIEAQAKMKRHATRKGRGGQA